MHVRRITLSAFAACTLAATVGCSSTNRAPAQTYVLTNDQTASMVATDDIGAAIFAPTALAGNFRPYAGRLDGPAQAAFMTQVNESTIAGVRTE